MNLPTFQGTRNTSGYRDPFAAALPKAAPTIVAGSPANGQGAKNTTAYPSYPTPASSGSATTTVSKTAPSTTSQPATSQSITPPAGSDIYDLSTDPIVQKIQQLNKDNYGDAVASAQSNAKQDLINSGFSLSDALAANPDIAAAISGSPIGSVLTDAATNLAASQNPNSTAATLANTHTGNNNTINQNENDNNLFYSSDRANQLGQESQNYLGSISGAQNSLATALSGLLGGLTTEQQTEQQNLANTIETERENVIQNAISSGQVMLGYDSNGNPIFGNAPTTAAPSTSDTGGGTDTSTPYVAPTPTALAPVLAQILAHPASAGSSGAAGVATGQTKKNYQAKARAY